jgi:homopolymeric O-antigen transport system permease protein
VSSSAATSESFAGDVTVIKARRGWAPLDLKELWQYRELLYFLIWRDVKIRYKQTAIGVAWVFLQPVLLTALFTVVFGHFLKLPTNGPPYALMVGVAIVPWFLFATALTTATRSLVENQALVTKVYLPRIYIPIAQVLSGLVDFACGAAFVVGLMIWYGWTPTSHVWTLPFFFLFLVLTAIAVTLWLSALNVKYRDVQYTLQFIVQIWFFATPIVYALRNFPLGVQQWVGLNPMAGVVQGFRWALLGPDTARVGHLMLFSFGVVLVLLVGGIEYFRRVERSFADVV